MITHTPLVAGNLLIKTVVAMAMTNKKILFLASTYSLPPTWLLGGQFTLSFTDFSGACSVSIHKIVSLLLNFIAWICDKNYDVLKRNERCVTLMFFYLSSSFSKQLSCPILCTLVNISLCETTYKAAWPCIHVCRCCLLLHQTT